MKTTIVIRFKIQVSVINHFIHSEIYIISQGVTRTGFHWWFEPTITYEYSDAYHGQKLERAVIQTSTHSEELVDVSLEDGRVGGAMFNSARGSFSVLQTCCTLGWTKTEEIFRKVMSTSVPLTICVYDLSNI